MSYENNLREEICKIGHMLWSEGYTPSNSGNIVVRIADDEFLCTPTRICKGLLKPEMILKVNSKLEVLEGYEPYKPTSEIRVHIKALQVREKFGAKASIHTHAPYAQFYALKNIQVVPEESEIFKDVPIAPYAMPGTDDLAESVVPALEKAPVCLMEGHGAVATGKDLWDAFQMMESIESTAKAAYLMHQYEAAEKMIQFCSAAKEGR